LDERFGGDEEWGWLDGFVFHPFTAVISVFLSEFFSAEVEDV